MFIKDYVQSLNLTFGQSIRQDCPECGGNNTFSATNKDGTLLWQCFRSSCNLRGKDNAVLHLDNVNFQLRNSHRNTNDVWNIPKYFTYALLNDRCRKYCEYWRIDNPKYDLRYDPKLDRLVFLLRNYQGILCGAVGRSLVRYNQPRWYVYQRNHSCPYMLFKTACRAILVEDSISAVRVSSICSSVSLLGTNISDEGIQYLLKYKQLFIALDDDATDKALKLQNRLKAFRDTRIIPLKKDIKYYSDSELETLKRIIENETL